MKLYTLTLLARSQPYTSKSTALKHAARFIRCQLADAIPPEFETLFQQKEYAKCIETWNSFVDSFYKSNSYKAKIEETYVDGAFA